MTSPVLILSTASVPADHSCGQGEIRDAVAQLAPDHPLLRVFDSAGIDRRTFAFPPSYYLELRSFRERNDRWLSAALAMGEKAMRAAINDAQIEAREIDILIFVTTTGLATPSVDALLVEQLGLRQDVTRIPIFGMKLLLSPELAKFMKTRLRAPVDEFLEKHLLTLDRITHFILHPGGARVLDAYGEILGIGEDRLSLSRESLRRNGNTSSASVLLALDELMRSEKPRKGDVGLMLAPGPGFALEMALLLW